ncbi:MAG: hypothetical protein ACOYJD_05135 [Christensenellales bacterium]|jgi:hypothetical protein
MRIASAIKYQLWSVKNSLIIYYAIMYALFILAIVNLRAAQQANMVVSMGGFEGASIIFIFVMGLNLFKESFNMLMQNGIDRKRIFASSIVVLLIVAAFMALLDLINSNIVGGMISYTTFFSQIYSSSVMKIGYIGELLWSMVFYAGFAVIGLFIASLYYRMSKGMKILVSVGVPALMFIGLPLFDGRVFGGKLFAAIGRFVNFIFGFAHGGNPYIYVMCGTAFLIIAAALVWLVIRRAQVKV